MDTSKLRSQKGKTKVVSFANLKIEFINSRRRKGGVERYIRWLDDNLNMFDDWIKLTERDFAKLTKQDIEEFLYYLKTDYWNKSKKQNGLAITCINGKFRTLKCFFNYLESEMNLNNPVKGLKPFKVPASGEIWPYTLEEIRRLLSAPDRRVFTGLRDYCLMLFLLDSGVRISEALNVKIRDIDINSGLVLVTGKGDKKRAVFFSKDVAKELKAYIETYLFDAVEDDYLFCNRTGTRLQYKSIQQTVQRAGEKMGVPRSTCHRFRHSYCTFYLENGGDIAHLQQDVGHSDISTTANYTKFTTTERKQMHTRHSPVRAVLFNR